MGRERERDLEGRINKTLENLKFLLIELFNEDIEKLRVYIYIYKKRRIKISRERLKNTERACI